MYNDYPVCPEKVKVSNDMLSAYFKKIDEKDALRDKKECLLHYRNLQLYLDLGLKIKKVH